MAGHSRPKDGVLSHAYVPAMSRGCGVHVRSTASLSYSIVKQQRAPACRLA